jgi:hypothetical protein
VARDWVSTPFIQQTGRVILRFNPVMCVAILNLDNGLFLEKGRWTAHPNLADRFDDLESARRVVSHSKIRNAAVAMLSGDPPRTSGFLWLTNPS